MTDVEDHHRLSRSSSKGDLNWSLVEQYTKTTGSIVDQREATSLVSQSTSLSGSKGDLNVGLVESEDAAFILIDQRTKNCNSINSTSSIVDESKVTSPVSQSTESSSVNLNSNVKKSNCNYRSNQEIAVFDENGEQLFAKWINVSKTNWTL